MPPDDRRPSPNPIEIDPDKRCMEGRRKEESDPIRVMRDLTASDRRSFVRYGVRGQWRVHDRERSRLIGIVCDIGLGGLRMEAPEPIPPARRHALSIEVRADGSERTRIELIARCAWHHARPDLQFEAGFEFVEMTPQMRSRIAQYIDELGL
jgi:hypothetical protein